MQGEIWDAGRDVGCGMQDHAGRDAGKDVRKDAGRDPGCTEGCGIREDEG